MKTIVIKTEIEQFQEQYPELYQQIFDLGYNSYKLQQELYDEENPSKYDEGMDYEPYPDPEPAKPEDDSERFCIWDTWQNVYEQAQHLVKSEYTTRMDWKMFMTNYQDHARFMYIAWNPTHKIFAVESDPSVIDVYYPHLVNATDLTGENHKERV